MFFVCLQLFLSEKKSSKGNVILSEYLALQFHVDPPTAERRIDVTFFTQKYVGGMYVQVHNRFQSVWLVWMKEFMGVSKVEIARKQIAI